jgi:cyclophilin family peptidyl-prolyl cis-trans isomerase
MIRALRRSLALLTLVSVIVGACSPSGGPTASTVAPSANLRNCPTQEPPPLAAGQTRTVTIKTELGEILIHVEADLSPIAAGNFVALADCGWYDGVVFHRVVPGFVIQGGDGENGRSPNVDPARVGTGGPGYTITDEPVTALYARGIVAMARTAQPNSVGSQFFIILDDSARRSLASANTYQIIGAVATGMDTVDAIAAAADAEIPSEPVVMTDVSVSSN